MNEHDQQVSGVEATANPAPSQGRRRLVKGAIFAVPAIVTLRTGFTRTPSGPPTVEEALNSFCNGGGEAALGYQSFVNAYGQPNPPFDCEAGQG